MEIGQYRQRPREGQRPRLVLPGAALDIINAQPRFADNPFVFAGRGNSHFSGYSKSKAAFDAKVRLAQWQLHDLRRTARSLMSRAGIRPDIAERVLGHAIAGVEGVYDRHQYRDEKSDALRNPAGLVSSIIKSPADNVVPIAGVANEPRGIFHVGAHQTQTSVRDRALCGFA